MAVLTLGLALIAQWGAPPVELDVRRDAITDRVSAFARIHGDDGRLSIGCDPDRFRGVRVMLDGPYWLARENILTGVRSFPIRFDNTRRHRGRFETSARLAWIDGRSRTRSFIGWARSSQQVVVRVRDIEGRFIDMRFPLAEARGTIDQAVAICNGAAPPPETGSVALPGT